jgi:hypothetical protein
MEEFLQTDMFEIQGKRAVFSAKDYVIPPLPYPTPILYATLYVC